MAASANAERVDALLFELSRHRFAFRLSDVDEVTQACALQALPRAPPPVCGVLNLRGEVIPVLDLRARFDLTAKDLALSDLFVIARLGVRRVAFKVDDVLGIESVSFTELQQAAHLPPTLAHVAGVAPVEDGVLLICDLATFLNSDESDQLEHALTTRGLEATS